MDTTAEQTIHRMNDVLANQVSAGEVVERPASVIKELVENSIDAEAKSIRVDILRGGIASMKVADNGKGMSRTDLALCLQRHATSKLLTFDDLYSIRHMGFRGEALPSIASVAHLRIATRRQEDVEGSQIVCHGGQEEPICAVGCPPGTEIEVRDLFYNTPARREFLKKESTESAHIEHQLQLHALAFPDIRFTFVRDGQVVFDLPATHDLRQRIAGFSGREMAEKLLRIRPYHDMGIQIEGYISLPSEARRNRKDQFIFLNNRPIEDKIITMAVRDGYGGFPNGLHPSIFLYLTMDPGLVDVNVHPAKREVRFRRPSDVTTAIIDAIAGTLADYARGEAPEPAPAAPHLPPMQSTAPAPREIHRQPLPPRPEPRTPAPLHTPAPKQEERPHTPPTLRLVVEPRQQTLPLAQAQPPAQSSEEEPQQGTFPSGYRGPRFRSLGTLHGQYALFENPEGLVILSPRAARERIIFEKLLRKSRGEEHISQQLLQPIIIELDARDVPLAREINEHLRDAGFTISEFGDRCMRVESIPHILSLSEIENFIYDLIHTFTIGEMRRKRDDNPTRLLAVRLAQQQASREDIRDWLQDPLPLLLDLLNCENPYCTARGKPTMIPYTLSEMQRKFQAL